MCDHKMKNKKYKSGNRRKRSMAHIYIYMTADSPGYVQGFLKKWQGKTRFKG